MAEEEREPELWERSLFVAGRAVAIGHGDRDEDGRQDVYHFAAGDPVPFAEKLEGLQGLVVNGYLIPEEVYEQDSVYGPGPDGPVRVGSVDG